MLKAVITVLILCISHCTVSATQTKKTDAQEFRQFCLDTSAKESLFNEFRRHTTLNSTVESHDINVGKECVNDIESNHPAFTYLWDLFRENDRFGNPFTVNYPKAGHFSPTTLRYVKIAADLQAFFSSIENLKIVEIGGGYGGLCRILTQVFNVKDYTIVDWPEALLLTKKYLDHYHITNVTYKPLDKLDQDITADLVICGNVFSLYRKELQERFLQRVIKQAPRGYMICHYAEREGMTTMTPKELSLQLKQLHPGLQSLPDTPKTYSCSWLNVWND